MQDIPKMLRAFARRPGCSAYAGDSKKIELLIHYFWCRQLVPSLPFETFLDRFELLADADEQNLKHPEAAINTFCPRSQARAAATGRQQWSAKQVADFLSLYVDMIREAENAKQPIPLTLNGFLEHIQADYLAGAFSSAEPAASGDTPQPPAAAAPAASASPRRRQAREAAAEEGDGSFVAGSRVSYTNSHGRQYASVVQSVKQDADRAYVTVLTDDGELFEDVGVASVRRLDLPLPAPPADKDHNPLPCLGEFQVTLPDAARRPLASALSVVSREPKPAVGEVLASHVERLADNLFFCLTAAWSDAGVYLDSYLSNSPLAAEVLAAERPRTRLPGVYTFLLPDGFYRVSIASLA